MNDNLRFWWRWPVCPRHTACCPMWARQTGSRHHPSDTTAELLSHPAEKDSLLLVMSQITLWCHKQVTMQEAEPAGCEQMWVSLMSPPPHFSMQVVWLSRVSPAWWSRSGSMSATQNQSDNHSSVWVCYRKPSGVSEHWEAVMTAQKVQMFHLTCVSYRKPELHKSTRDYLLLLWLPSQLWHKTSCHRGRDPHRGHKLETH